MGLHGCNSTGEINEEKFSEPMPWIGLYIAGGSLVCALFMAIDTFYGFRQRKPWFPCKFFSLNAASLTFLSIATKLPVDLNTFMPSRQDQLTKLSGTILICTAVGNFMTSLGDMKDSEMLSNIVALVILVITVVINIGIQMGTGVIYAFLPEHAIIMSFMILLLIILVSSALTVLTAKRLLQEKCWRKSGVLPIKEAVEYETFRFDKLKEVVNEHWMMAHSSSPQYVLGRSATCIASGAFCLLSALILLEASVRSFISSSLDFCSGESDYKWSIKWVLISQVIAVVVGTIAPAIRWFTAICFRRPEGRKGICRDELTLEWYWIQSLVEWKESILPFDISDRRCWKIAYASKNRVLDSCIGMQIVVVLVCKFVCLASILPMIWLSILFSCCCCNRCWKNKESDILQSKSLQPYVLLLEGEGHSVRQIMKRGRHYPGQWIDKGRKNQPTHLINLLKKSTSPEGFKGLSEFDRYQLDLQTEERPPNCWALPVVILTSIAVALPNDDQTKIESLWHAVDEGLRYVRFIENTIHNYSLRGVRKAADMIWFDMDLNKLINREKHAKELIEELEKKGSQRFRDFKSGSGRETPPSEWPAKILAANSMYRISQTILLNHNDKLGTVDSLFEWLQTTIADILIACLSNLPRMILKECRSHRIEEMEGGVKNAAYVLGEAETILEILREHQFPPINPSHMDDIDQWEPDLIYAHW